MAGKRLGGAVFWGCKSERQDVLRSSHTRNDLDVADGDGVAVVSAPPHTRDNQHGATPRRRVHAQPSPYTGRPESCIRRKPIPWTCSLRQPDLRWLHGGVECYALVARHHRHHHHRDLPEHRRTPPPVPPPLLGPPEIHGQHIPQTTGADSSIPRTADIPRHRRSQANAWPDEHADSQSAITDEPAAGSLTPLTHLASPKSQPLALPHRKSCSTHRQTAMHWPHNDADSPNVANKPFHGQTATPNTIPESPNSHALARRHR